jgi:hypothetical protein
VLNLAQDNIAAKRILSIEKSSDFVGDRNGDLSVCITSPQTSELSRVLALGNTYVDVLTTIIVQV